MTVPVCIADCLQDGPAIRPLKAPKSLVWTYFRVEGSGELEARRFQGCPCGCGNLVADPQTMPDDKSRLPIFEWGHETTPTEEEMRKLALEIVVAVVKPIGGGVLKQVLK